jgi:hypothetical protein
VNRLAAATSITLTIVAVQDVPKEEKAAFRSPTDADSIATV